ncbi:cell division protein ZipA [Kushneria marisflavi]|uniref:Cell division protein ZipA n=1 Tax=Kushneria marisflavi TaxID=157779 RepID=A0A240ULC9_9GAMM|nr:cell division protein ZipA [Kushneria marisflavi]ART62304.1 cell division protein ZipA [Kushneria marisflavi]RKD87407.1 cell division protein ZipA [Kushneria marisflavi]
MELREWLIILGLVLVAIILVDGVRRLQRQRRGLRMDLSRDIDSSAPARDPKDIEREERMNWELPNGGARVISRGENEFDDRFDEPDMDTWDEDIDRARERDDVAPARDEDFDDERDMPAYQTRERRGSREVDDPQDREYDHDDDDMEELPPRRRDDFARRLKSVFPFGEGKRAPRQKTRPAEPPREKAPSMTERPADREEVFEDDDPLFASGDRRDPPPDAFDFEREEDMAPRYEPEPEEEMPASHSRFDSARWASRHPVLERAARGMIEGESARTALKDAEEIVVISVMSRDEDGFHGPDLLQLVLACGLRLDDRGVFHRFETESSQSPLQFSMVNVVKPGTFDLEDMEEEATPGVTFLMPMPSAESSREAFEAMFETAMVLVRNLGGELKDENHSVMTGQTVEFARQRVHEFERRWRLHHQAH